MVMKSRQLERIVKGFANHRRLDILELLQRTPELSVEEIAEKLSIGYENASDHIRKLAIAGLVMKRHYKGNSYKVFEIALNSDDEWVVVYEPLYENAVAKLFTRPVAEWCEVVEWQGQKVERFVKI